MNVNQALDISIKEIKMFDTLSHDWQDASSVMTDIVATYREQIIKGGTVTRDSIDGISIANSCAMLCLNIKEMCIVLMGRFQTTMLLLSTMKNMEEEFEDPDIEDCYQILLTLKNFLNTVVLNDSIPDAIETINTVFVNGAASQIEIMSTRYPALEKAVAGAKIGITQILEYVEDKIRDCEEE